MERRKKKEKKPRKPMSLDKIVSSRITVLACFILVLFGILLVRLIYLQGIAHDHYLAKQEDYTSIRQYTMAPRGQIYDRKGNVIAKTVVSHNIVYTSPNNMNVEDYLVYANRLGSVFDVEISDFTEWERKDAYLVYCQLLDPSDPKYNGIYLLDDQQKKAYEAGEWEETNKLYSTIMANMTMDDVNTIPESDQMVYAIYNRMMANASTGQQSVILEDVTDTDVAYLVEHKTEFPGFDVDFGGWKREYPYGESLSDVIGGVSTSTAGLPIEHADYYLSKGYQYNAQVGTSGLELEYNDLLAGTEEIAKITYDSNGLAHKQVIQEARKGNDIYLSIDMDLQQTLDASVKQALLSSAGTKNRENFSKLFMCMMNPKTGDMLALSGYDVNLETAQVSYFASGNYSYLVHPGSSIKGVTVYMGESEGVMQEDEYVNDVRMNIGGQSLGSFADHGPVNDVMALSVSSNVYMFHVAIRLGGDQYVEGKGLNIENPRKTLNLMRNYFSQFGLGNKTGIDVPDEAMARMGTSEIPGMLLNYSIGQYDMYTPVQLMQYAGVVANDGVMYQPKFYSYSKEVNGDEIFDINEPVLKNELPKENMSHLERVQMGMQACVADGNCYNGIASVGYTMAAKTGTAEVGQWTTANLVGFGPYEDPTMAFACSAPESSINTSEVSMNICAEKVVQGPIAKYFELYYPDGQLKDDNVYEGDY